MTNLFHYVRELGHQTFAERPFSATDSLVFTQIVYMPMEGLADQGETVSVQELWTFLLQTYPDGFKDPYQRKRYELTKTCAQSARFSGLPITGYINNVDSRKETQFCACMFLLPDGSRYVAFRGTDLTVAGWKEDLNMSFMTVPAQRQAVQYVQQAAAIDVPLMLGGHSKGGHLALYAAARAGAKAQARITRVYSFDGPGVDEKTLHSKGYQWISDCVESYIPQSSVVGMLLCYHPVYKVVKSSAIGLLQHDVLTWHVRDGSFEMLEGLDLGTRLTDEALRLWIDKLTLDERKLLTDTTFRLISTLDPETIDPLVQNLPASSIRLFSAFRHIEPETRAELRRLLGELFSSSASEAARTLLPGTFRRFFELTIPALRPETKTDGAGSAEKALHDTASDEPTAATTTNEKRPSPA